MTTTNKISTGGVMLIWLLQIIFIILKLTNAIQWSWVWVLTPYWASFSFVVLLFMAIIMAACIIDARKHR